MGDQIRGRAAGWYMWGQAELWGSYWSRGSRFGCSCLSERSCCALLVVADWDVALVPALPLAMTRRISHFQVVFYWLSYEWEYDLKCHLDYFRVTI